VGTDVLEFFTPQIRIQIKFSQYTTGLLLHAKFGPDEGDRHSSPMKSKMWSNLHYFGEQFFIPQQQQYTLITDQSEIWHRSVRCGSISPTTNLALTGRVGTGSPNFKVKSCGAVENQRHNVTICRRSLGGATVVSA